MLWAYIFFSFHLLFFFELHYIPFLVRLVLAWAWESEIAFYFLLGLLQVPDDADFTPFLVEMALKFSEVVCGDQGLCFLQQPQASSDNITGIVVEYLIS